MDEEINRQWERYLNPEELRPSLILASIYISAFEMLKISIIDHIKDFFTHGYDENGLIISNEYNEKVLTKDKSPTYASLKWLLDHEAINNTDIEIFEKIKKFRNIIAHELNKLLSNGLTYEFNDRFNDLVHLLDKIEKWWIINVEIPTSDDFDDFTEINLDEIQPGPIMNLRMLIDIALGEEEAAYYYINEFKKLSKSKNNGNSK